MKLQMYLCNGIDDTGCNGVDGEDWNVENYKDAYSTHPKIKHYSTRECVRMAYKGEYPEECAYKSYDPRRDFDYAGRQRDRVPDS